MSQVENYYAELLNSKTFGNLGIKIPELTNEVAITLKNRIENINLYLHSYTLYKNFFYGTFTVIDFLDLAYTMGFKGIAINIETGDKKSLQNKTAKEISEISDHAKSLNLKINIDISSSTMKELKTAIKIANGLDSKYIRFYIRDSGYVSEIINRAVHDIKLMAELAKENDITILLEQHEDLKSSELLEIVKQVNSDNCKLLFDYGNMINSNEKPLDALEIMAPYIKHVHVKGVKIVEVENGLAHAGVPEENDDLPHAKLMFDLLMLGKEEAQVEIFYLEEVTGYYAPAYRFDNEEEDALIPDRTVSITKLPEDIQLEELLMKEKRYASKQMIFIQSLLTELKTIANIKLKLKCNKEYYGNH